MQLEPGGALISLPVAGPGKTLAGAPGKFNFYSSKVRRLDC